MEHSELSLTIENADFKGKKQIWVERNNALVYIRFYDKIEISVYPLDYKTATLDVVTDKSKE